MSAETPKSPEPLETAASNPESVAPAAAEEGSAASPIPESPQVESPKAESLKAELAELRSQALAQAIAALPDKSPESTPEGQPEPKPETLEIQPPELAAIATPDVPVPTDRPTDPNAQIRLKTEQGYLWVLLPPETTDKSDQTVRYSWTELVHQLQQRLRGDTRSWPAGTSVRLLARDRLLDSTQLQELAEILVKSQLQLKRIYTSRRQTAVAAATAGYSVEQQAIPQLQLGKPTDPKAADSSKSSEVAPAQAEPLYLEMTLRSGAEVRHNGSVIVHGDLNPGSSIVADGDILVWGRLRGTVHAGAQGNASSVILALQMEPAQIRIADFVARGPSNPPTEFFPEVAYVTPQGQISIAKATDFSRTAVK